MHLWLLLAGVFILQESLSASYIVLQALDANYPLLLIHLLWFVIAAAETIAGYFFGKWVRSHAAYTRLGAWAEKKAVEVHSYVGDTGEKVGLVALTLLTLPLVTGFVGAWLTIPFWQLFLFSMFGDLIWYGSIWLGAYGSHALASGFIGTIIIAAVISVAVSVPLHFMRRSK